MKALISTLEPRESGYRVAQVVADDQTFAVAEGLFWADCADACVADEFWYDPQDETIKPFPHPVEVAQPQPQPTVDGAQTL